MIWFAELWEFVRRFMESGGVALTAIAISLLIQWAVIVERFIYFYFVYPREARQVISEWHAREDTTSWYAHRIRDAWLSQASIRLNAGVNLIKTLVAITPLIGLFGTVYGMITVFEALAQQGSGNARLMANGISMATVPTMAGMVAAIVGLFTSSRIEQLVRNRIDALADSMPHH